MSEDDKGKRSIWKHPLVAALLTFVVTVGAAYWLQKEPVLTYEVFPATSFTSEERVLSIQIVRIENSGDQEAEDVQFLVTLADGAEAVEARADLSSKAIDYEMVSDTTSGRLIYLFPMLNPGESVRFSFLVDGSDQGVIDVALRGRGVTGFLRLTQLSEEMRLDNIKRMGYLLIGTILLLCLLMIIDWVIRPPRRFQKPEDIPEAEAP